MIFKLNFHPKATHEFIEAAVWYEKQKAGLGNKFELSVEAIIEKLKHSPEAFRYTRKPFREASVILFPYTIVYKINKRVKTVYIVAVYHTSRNPKRKFRK